MAGLAARTAAASGAEVTCVNRTLARAQRLADAVGGRAVPLTELGTALTRADVLVTCTGARTATRTAADLAGTPGTRGGRPGPPADVDSDVAEAGITLVNLDRLVVEQYDPASLAEVEAARQVVQPRSATSSGLRRAAQVAPTVVALRTMAADVMAPSCAAWSPGCPAWMTTSGTRSADRTPDRGQAAARADRAGPGAVQRPRGTRLRRRAV